MATRNSGLHGGFIQELHIVRYYIVANVGGFIATNYDAVPKYWRAVTQHVTYGYSSDTVRGVL